METTAKRFESRAADSRRLAKLCRRQARLCRIRLICLRPLAALGLQWARRATLDLRDALAECEYAHEEHAQNAAMAAATAQEKTLPDFGGALQEALEDCGCRTWEDAMRALVAGAVDYDDWQDLILRCAEIADANPAMKRADGMPWTEAAIVDLDWLLGSAVECADQPADFRRRVMVDLVTCGFLGDIARRTASWLPESAQT